MARPARIAREGVINAAIQILDAEGYGALSLDRIAERLEVRAPSLYHYYPDKAAILDEVAITILGNLGVDAEGFDDWRDALVAFCLAFHQRITEHPNVVVLLIEHMPERSVLRGFDRSAGALSRAGIPVEHRAIILESVQHFLWGMVLYQAVGRVNDAFRRPVDPVRYPQWAAAAQASAMSDAVLLELGIRALLDGLSARLGALDDILEETT